MMSLRILRSSVLGLGLIGLLTTGCNPFAVEEDKGQGKGEACSAELICRDKLDCVDARCIPEDQGADGQPCFEGICRAELTCNEAETCVPKKAGEGEACTGTPDCNLGLYCMAPANLCVPDSMGHEGEDCWGADDLCSGQLVCDNGTCSSGTVLNVGDECDPDDSKCDGGLYCLDSGGVAPVCAPDGEGHQDQSCFTHGGLDRCEASLTCLYNADLTDICAGTDQGTEDNACYGDGYCQPGLVCGANDLCVTDTGLPAGSACSPGANECQSQLWCMQVGTDGICTPNNQGHVDQACFYNPDGSAYLCAEGLGCLFNPSDATLCADASQGGPGASCYAGDFCKPELECDGTTCTDGSLGKEGDACADDSQCDANLYCMNDAWCAPSSLGHLAENCWFWSGTNRCDATLACKNVDGLLACVPGNEGDSGQPCITTGGYQDACVTGLNCVAGECTSGGTADVGETCTDAGDCLTGLICLDTDGGKICANQDTGGHSQACVLGTTCATGLVCRAIPALGDSFCLNSDEGAADGPCYQGSYCEANLACGIFAGSQPVCAPLGVGAEGQGCYQSMCLDGGNLSCITLYPSASELCVPQGFGGPDQECYIDQCSQQNLACREFIGLGKRCIDQADQSGQITQPCYLGECLAGDNSTCTTMEAGDPLCLISGGEGFEGQACVGDLCAQSLHCLLGHNVCTLDTVGGLGQSCYNPGQDDWCIAGLVCNLSTNLCDPPLCHTLDATGWNALMDVALRFDWNNWELTVVHGSQASGARACTVPDPQEPFWNPSCIGLSSNGSVSGQARSVAMGSTNLAIAGNDGQGGLFVDLLSNTPAYGLIAGLTVDVPRLDLGRDTDTLALSRWDGPNNRLYLYDSNGGQLGTFGFVSTNCETNDVAAIPDRPGAAVAAREHDGPNGLLMVSFFNGSATINRHLIGASTNGVANVDAVEFTGNNRYLAAAVRDFQGGTKIWFYNTSLDDPAQWDRVARLELGGLLGANERVVDLEFNQGEDLMLAHVYDDAGGNSRTMFFRFLNYTNSFQLYYLGDRFAPGAGRMDYDGDYYAVSGVNQVTVCDAFRTSQSFGLGIGCGTNQDCPSPDFPECRTFNIGPGAASVNFCSNNCALDSECGQNTGQEICVPDDQGANACRPRSLPNVSFYDSFNTGSAGQAVCTGGDWQYAGTACDAIYSSGANTLFGQSMEIMANAQGTVYYLLEAGLSQFDFRVEAWLEQTVNDPATDVVTLNLGPVPGGGGGSDHLELGRMPACTSYTDWAVARNDSCENAVVPLGPRVSGGPIHFLIDVHHSSNKATFCVNDSCREVSIFDWNLVPEALWFGSGDTAYYVDDVTVSILP